LTVPVILPKSPRHGGHHHVTTAKCAAECAASWSTSGLTAGAGRGRGAATAIDETYLPPDRSSRGRPLGHKYCLTPPVAGDPGRRVRPWRLWYLGVVELQASAGTTGLPGLPGVCRRRSRSCRVTPSKPAHLHRAQPAARICWRGRGQPAPQDRCRREFPRRRLGRAAGLVAGRGPSSTGPPAPEQVLTQGGGRRDRRADCPGEHRHGVSDDGLDADYSLRRMERYSRRPTRAAPAGGPSSNKADVLRGRRARVAEVEAAAGGARLWR